MHLRSFRYYMLINLIHPFIFFIFIHLSSIFPYFFMYEWHVFVCWHHPIVYLMLRDCQLMCCRVGIYAIDILSTTFWYWHSTLSTLGLMSHWCFRLWLAQSSQQSTIRQKYPQPASYACLAWDTKSSHHLEWSQLSKSKRQYINKLLSLLYKVNTNYWILKTCSLTDLMYWFFHTTIAFSYKVIYFIPKLTSICVLFPY